MNSNHTKTGLRIEPIRRHIAARARRRRDAVENPPRPPMRLTPETEQLADLFIYARQFKRPLAA